MALKRIQPATWIVLMMIVLTFIGLLTAGDYGLPCDEPAEQVILKENIKEYAYRLLGEDSQAYRALDAQGVRRISESVERDHGQSAYYLAAPLLALEPVAPDRLLLLWHAYTWLWFMVGVISLYALARCLSLNRAMAFATAMFYYLSPRFFAEGHYNNKDMVLLSLVLWTLASGARFFQEPTYRRAAVFSLAGALATNTKIVGAFAWGLIGLATLARLVARRQLTPAHIRVGLAAIGLYLAIYTALTPALWTDPFGYITYVVQNASGFSRWSGVVLYQGALYDQTRGMPLPHAYLPTMVAVTTPIAFLLIMAIGQIYTVIRCLRGDKRRPLLMALTALWLFPALYTVVRQPILYNGWRHFYFIYAGLCAMGGLGLEAIAGWLPNRRAVKAVAAAALGAVLLWQGLGIAQNHPYQYGYYNALAGEASARYELDYWDVSTVNAMRTLSATVQGTDAPLELGSRDDMSAFGLTHGYTVLTPGEKTRLTVTDDADAPYLYLNATYAIIYGVPPPDGYEVLFTLKSYGREIGTVYRRLATP